MKTDRKFSISNIFYGITNVVFDIVVVSLALRFIFKLFGANPNAGIVQWLYENTGVLLDPFRGIFPVRTFSGDFVLEFNTLIAIVMYILLYQLLIMIFSYIYSFGQE